MTPRRGRRGADDGSALILALIVITVIGVVMAALIQFVTTGVSTTPQFVSQRNTAYDVDGAVDGAINAIRGSSLLGAKSYGDCGPFQPGAGTDGVAVRVECHPTSTSGGSFDDSPPNAILTLGTESSIGNLSYDQDGTDVLNVAGNVYTNGPLSVSGGNNAKLSVEGDVTATGACTGSDRVTATGLFKCNSSGNSTGADPNYPSGIAQVPMSTVDPPATCVNSTSVVAFSPGYYSEVPEIPSGCNGSTLWFQPGDYYFDFPQARSLWDVADHHHVVGGTPLGWSASSASSNTQTCDPTKSGVQFILGGPTRIQVQQQGSTFDLCGSKDATGYQNQRIVMTTLQSGSRSTTGPVKLSPTHDANVPSEEKYTPAAATHDKDGVPGLATMTKNSKTAAIDLSAFPNVPAGATITKAELVVTHGEEDKSNQDVSLDVSMSRNGVDNTRNGVAIDSCNFTKTTDPITSVVTWGLCDSAPIDITDMVTGSFGYSWLNSLKVRYHASSKFQGSNPAPLTDALDGVTLKVTYIAPGQEKSSCGDGCTLLTSTVDNNLWLRGTVYVPNGFLDLRLHNKDATIFNRGVICRALHARIESSFKQTESPFSIPQATSSRRVLFTGYVGTRPMLRAVVTYIDQNPDSDKAQPGYSVTVDSWSVLRRQ